MIGIYSICCLNTGKLYVGSSVNISKRVKQHSSELARGIHKNIYLQRAWNKYGGNSFRFNLIDLVNSAPDLEDKESFWIKYFDSTNNKKGYNLLNAPANIATYGSKNGQSKLFADDVEKIIELIYKGYTNRKIAATIGVAITSETISDIRRRHTWAHIRPDIESFPISPSNHAFTAAEVSKVKKKLNRGISIDDIVRQYKVTRNWVWLVVNERIWADVEPKITAIIENPSYKLSEKDVLEIKKLLGKNNLTHREIAGHYGVSVGCISHIQQGSTWGNVGNDIDLSDRKNLAHKLSREAIIEIKERILSGESVSTIAGDFAVSPGLISSIKTNRRHKNVGPSMSTVTYTRKPKLTKETVKQIKTLLNAGVDVKEIAMICNTNVSKIQRIKTGATWVNVI